jgi:hypothetical protein
MFSTEVWGRSTAVVKAKWNSSGGDARPDQEHLRQEVVPINLELCIY